MPFTAVANRVYRDPLTVQWGNDMIGNDNALREITPKAFVRFEGCGTSINSLNVASITVTGTGKYKINFTTAMANSNSLVVGSTRLQITNQEVIFNVQDVSSTLTEVITSRGGTFFEPGITSVIVYNTSLG